MKSDNSDTDIKRNKIMRDGLLCTENIKNRKNNADENFRENSETKSKAIDPCCHPLKTCQHNKRNISNKNVVCYGKSSKIKNVKMSQNCPLQKKMKKQVLQAEAKNAPQFENFETEMSIHVKTCSTTEMPKNIQ